MDSPDLLARVQSLDDLELAILLCLMSGNHGIIQTDSDSVAALQHELLLAGRRSFGLTATSFQCSADMTLEEFTSHLLVEKSSLADSLDYAGNDGVCIPNLVVVRDLASAGRHIQIQALELARSKRIFTHSRPICASTFLVALHLGCGVRASGQAPSGLDVPLTFS